MDQFKISGPAIISFSGGRTSGYMLRLILDAYGGSLPHDVAVVFCNTGKEMPETLDFVQACSAHWNVSITWLEYRSGKEFAIVSYETASRNGEPFEAVITDRNFLPNPVARICTIEMKILTTERYAVQMRGWTFFTNVIGYRADEPSRVAKLEESRSAAFGRYAPLALAGITKRDVAEFWHNNAFDLHLPNVNGVAMHGNCDLCFLKGEKQIVSLIRENPKRAIWWMQQEDRIRSYGQIDGDAGRFRPDRPSYREMHDFSMRQQEMIEFDNQELIDCACTD